MNELAPPRVVVAGDCVQCKKPLPAGRVFVCEACQRADAADARELLSKLRELATGLRGALNTYDATGGIHCSDGKCEACAAIAELRTYTRDLELAVSDFDRAIDAEQRAIDAEPAVVLTGISFGAEVPSGGAVAAFENPTDLPITLGCGDRRVTVEPHTIHMLPILRGDKWTVL